MAPERGSHGAMLRAERSRLGEHLVLALVPAGRGGPAVRRVALLLLALALMVPSLASAHDTSYSYVDLSWGRERIALTVSVHRDDVAQALGIAAPESLMAAPFLNREAERVASLVTTRYHVGAGER